MPNLLLTPSLVRSRFGRRLLLLFVLCSLLPTLAVALLSYGTVTRQLRQASVVRLDHAGRLVGSAIVERLEFLSQEFARLPARPVACAPDRTGRCEAVLDYGLTAVVFEPVNGAPVPLAGRIDPVPRLNARERAALATGRSVLAFRAVNGRPVLYLVRVAPLAAGLLIGQVDPAYLWGPPDQAPLVESMQLHLADSDGTIISRQRLDVRLPAAVRSDRPAGTLDWSVDGVDQVAAWSRLPEADGVAMPALTLVVSEARSVVLAPMADFARTFPVVLTVALGAAVLLGLSQLRQSLVPLNALHEGTRRLALRQFDQPVEVASKDEFADLAASFNAMAEQLRRQFGVLATAAEVDRAVLSSVDTRWIVRTVLARMRDLCPCDLVAVTLLDPAGGDEATTWVEDPDPAHRPGAAVARLDAAERQRLAEGPDAVPLGATEAAAWLAPLMVRGAQALVLLPLRYQGRLVGVITIAATGQPPWTAEDLVQAGRLAGQCALALTNARMVEQIRLLAFHDGLTGLPNRISFKRRLGEELERCREDGGQVAVFLLDIDHFNRINDSLGHKFGDRLVQEVAARIRATCLAAAPAAEVARLGGDEFTILLPRAAGPDQIAGLARSVLEAFAAPFLIEGEEVFASTSIGVAVHPADGADIESLLKNADVAMYQAKLKGRGRCELYADSMSARAARRLALEGQLRKAIDAGQLGLQYQPIVELATGRVTSAEALIRWQHPEWGLVPPAEFIPVCEESGLITAVGEWTLRAVCDQQQRWLSRGLKPVPVAINLSGQQLRGDGIVEAVRRVLQSSGLDPRLLTVELTESVLMQGEGEAAATLQALAGLGVGLAIDDFGTGYSSLAYIKHFPVHALKIDRSFVHEVTSDPDDAAITTAVIAIGRALGLRVIAEGVETPDQVEFLRREGCDAIQGYLVSRPVDPEAFGAWLTGEGTVEALRPLVPRTRRAASGGLTRRSG